MCTTHANTLTTANKLTSKVSEQLELFNHVQALKDRYCTRHSLTNRMPSMETMKSK